MITFLIILISLIRLYACSEAESAISYIIGSMEQREIHTLSDFNTRINQIERALILIEGCESSLSSYRPYLLREVEKLFSSISFYTDKLDVIIPFRSSNTIHIPISVLRYGRETSEVPVRVIGVGNSERRYRSFSGVELSLDSKLLQMPPSEVATIRVVPDIGSAIWTFIAHGLSHEVIPSLEVSLKRQKPVIIGVDFEGQQFVQWLLGEGDVQTTDFLKDEGIIYRLSISKNVLNSSASTVEIQLEAELVGAYIQTYQIFVESQSPIEAKRILYKELRKEIFRGLH